MEKLIKMFYPDPDPDLDINRIYVKFEEVPGGREARKSRLFLSFAPVKRYIPCMLSGQSETVDSFSQEEIIRMAKDKDYKTEKFLLAFPHVKVPEDYAILVKYELTTITPENVYGVISETSDKELCNITFILEKKNVRLSAYFASGTASRQVLKIGDVFFVYYSEHPINGILHHTELKFELKLKPDTRIKLKYGKRASSWALFYEDQIMRDEYACEYIEYSPILVNWLVDNVVDVDIITSQEALMFAAYSLGAKPFMRVYVRKIYGHFVERDMDNVPTNLTAIFRKLALEKTPEQKIAALEDSISRFKRVAVMGT